MSFIKKMVSITLGDSLIIVFKVTELAINYKQCFWVKQNNRDRLKILVQHVLSSSDGNSPQ